MSIKLQSGTEIIGIPVRYTSGDVVTVPIPDAAVRDLEQWLEEHHDDLVRILKPYGLHPYQLAAPEFKRVLLKSEIQS